MRLRTLIWFYRRRLRVHWPQELLAAVGIAAGVALLFAVQVANSSITASAEQVMRAITGDATLQLAARDQRGFDARLLDEVAAIPGVLHAAPLLQQRATLTRDGRRASVELIGVAPSVDRFGGVATRSVLLGGIATEPGLLLPGVVGDALGLRGLERSGATPEVGIAVRGRAGTVRIGAAFGRDTIGSLADASIAVANLPVAQRLAGLPGRVTRILVEPEHLPGAQERVRAGLERLAAGRLTVAPVEAEIETLEQATAPNDQATGLFAAISAFVGLLFAFNAMLLTLPERRRSMADLRVQGFQVRDLALIVVFQAALLGVVASTAGLVVGDLLSRVAAQEPPSYLSFAFPLGTHRVVPFSAVAIAWAGGVAMTALAATMPLLDLRRQRLADPASASSEPGNALSPSTRLRLGVAGLTLVAGTSALLLVVPQATIVGIAALALATVLVVPAAFSLTLRLLDPLARRLRLNELALAVRALRATTLRSLALAATGAVAIFGSIAIEGAHRDLVTGLERNFADYLETADLWITAGGDENSLTTQSFPAADVARLRAVPGVRAVRVLHGGFLDIDDHRVWIVGRPRGDDEPIPHSQLVDGDLATATARLRAGGWAAVSETIARSQHAALGDPIALPTPTGRRSYRVAAIVTNLGWGPGAVILGAEDFRAAWGSDDPAAYELDLEAGAPLEATREAVAAALPAGSALRVQTVAERDRRFIALARQGLARLSQISTLLLIAAALAIAAAVGAALWQRRVALARLRIDGFEPLWLWRAVMLETGIVLAVGCLTGVAAGTYGHVLLSRWLESTTGFPAPFALGAAPLAATIAFVAAAALAVTAFPGYLAARTPARVGLSD